MYKHPNEEILVRYTLWPERVKFFGHGYNIRVVETSEDGQILISSSESLTKKYAGIIFWDQKNFKPLYEV